MFQADGEETANARGPIVDVSDLGTNTVPVTAERRCERPTIELTGVKYRIRCSGGGGREEEEERRRKKRGGKVGGGCGVGWGEGGGEDKEE